MSESPITVKAENLQVLVEDMFKGTKVFERTRGKQICRMVFELVKNGGNKTEAGMVAGLARSHDDDGNRRDEAKRRQVAVVEVRKALAIPEVASIYERLLEHRTISELFVQALDKEHIIHVLYKTAMKALEVDNFKQGVTALKEVGLLCGFYDQEVKKDVLELQERLEELADGVELMQSFKDSHDKLIADSKKKK